MVKQSLQAAVTICSPLQVSVLAFRSTCIPRESGQCPDATFQGTAGRLLCWVAIAKRLGNTEVLMPSSAPIHAPNHCPKAPKSLCKHGDTTVPTIAAFWNVAIQLLFISVS